MSKPEREREREREREHNIAKSYNNTIDYTRRCLVNYQPIIIRIYNNYIHKKRKSSKLYKVKYETEGGGGERERETVL